jgi:hypothetical protein
MMPPFFPVPISSTSSRRTTVFAPCVGIESFHGSQPSRRRAYPRSNRTSSSNPPQGPGPRLSQTACADRPPRSSKLPCECPTKLCVVDASHPQSTSSRTPSADSERMALHHNGYAHARASARSAVQRSHEAIVESDVRLSPSTAGFDRRARVTGGLTDVLVSPSERGEVYGPAGGHTADPWTLDHNQVAIEALLEDETGAGDMRTGRDHDDCAPAVIRRQTV